MYLGDDELCCVCRVGVRVSGMFRYILYMYIVCQGCS